VSQLVIALRQLSSQRLYTTINVTGLALGLGAAMLVGLYVRHELSYDRYHANAERIYRIARDVALPSGTTILDASMPAPAGPALASDFPQIHEAARLVPLIGSAEMIVGERRIFGGLIGAADPALFDVFDFDWIEGAPATAFADPSSIVLTASTARRYFGNGAALGQALQEANAIKPFKVMGVIRDLPDNTHLRFDMLVPMSLMELAGNGVLENWSSGGFHTYVLLRPGAEIAQIQSQSHGFMLRHMSPEVGLLNDFVAQPLTSIHLAPARYQDFRPNGSAQVVAASGVIAVLILAVACINFVNLATAAARRRAKEVGVRKTLGVARRRLIAQFLGESLLLTGVAALLALAAVELLLPTVGAFLEIDLELDYSNDVLVLAAFSAVTLLVAFAAGSFPAFYVSAFEPAKVLKGDVTRGRGASLLRGGLVGAQFAISIALLIATAVVYRQTMFMRNVDLGYDKERMVVVAGPRSGDVAERLEILKREWLAQPGVVAVSGSRAVPGGSGIGDLITGEGRDPALPPVNVGIVAIDLDFFSTYGIEMAAGRAFSSDIGADLADAAAPSDAYTEAIINPRAARELGWTPEEAVGKELWGVGLDGSSRERRPDEPARRIVGVTRDIYFRPLQEPIAPLVFILPRALFRSSSIKIDGRDVAGTLARIDAVWKRIVPEQTIRRTFLDDEFATFYRTEQRQAQMLSYAASFAIALACLGLFGLTSLTTEQRTKEIGIRKAMGGTMVDIVRLFAGELGRLALLANLIAWPVAYVAMRRWLDQFPYRIELGPATFVGSGLLVLAVAWLTVGAVAARAAVAKPIQSLRYE
jgi:putative ABC transport system permease protein